MGARTPPPRPSEQGVLVAFDLCRRFGVRVYEVVDLDRDAYYVPEGQAAFIRAGLRPDRRRWIAEWVLSEALEERISPDGT